MNHQRIYRFFGLVVPSIAGLALGQHSYAQTSAELPMGTSSNDVTSDTTGTQWKFVVGMGGANRPKYPGASESRTQFVPLISASYDRYFFGGVPGSGAPAGMGLYLYRSQETRIGLAVGTGFSKARKESDNARLRGLGDIENATRLALFAAHTMDGWLTLASSVSADVSGKKQGVIATFDAEGKYRVTDRLALSAGPGVTWANRDYTQTFFGVNPEQSARSGLPGYTAKSGLNLVRFSVGADYGISPQWKLVARASFARLQGDAVDSPITSKCSQNVYGLYASYRF